MAHFDVVIIGSGAGGGTIAVIGEVGTRELQGEVLAGRVGARRRA